MHGMSMPIPDFPYPVGNATKTSFPFMKDFTASRCFVFRGWTFIETAETAAPSIESSIAMPSTSFNGVS